MQVFFCMCIVYCLLFNACVVNSILGAVEPGSEGGKAYRRSVSLPEKSVINMI